MQQRETRIIQLDPNHLDEPYARQQIEYAARLLREGELVVLPTETVYGLGANAFNAQAAEQIFIAKGRPLSDPLIVHIADEHELENIVSQVPEAARKLAAAFWPGPLTMIMPAGPRVPGLITSGLPNVAVRMPAHPIARALIRAAGVPVAAPSANRFMHVSPTTARHAYTDLKGRVPLILDGGPCTVGVESTILDLCAEIPTILRPGGVGLEALRRVLPQVRPPRAGQVHDEEEELTQARVAPGQMRVHYSPSIPAYLFEGSVAAMRQAMLAELQTRQARGERVGVLIADEDLNTFQESGAIIYSLGHTPEQVATHLFAGLRTLEDAGVNVILCRSFAEQGLGLAIRDRLLKAAGSKVTKV
ncbi:L-threonylcarbamoyladenylate synthase [Dictyobacter aurantiacus]|uniref:Threonylcarbamoyl-AMP synthase n=1 Tax=Dictyobacter aurantiacus TaxID=1936993 RepID=A0A401Z880_9CHLR|nr:L-threonylcarbamoyladenylate synthase [Dictyobacter aurantiacus]GCE03071.1 threonylcarbamoyl-AMP synthase [Dictyobacter aurantiacus]